MKVNEASVPAKASLHIVLGEKGQVLPTQCRKMLQDEQRKIRSEYEERLRDLEKERMEVQDNKVQVCARPLQILC
jgi:hypothetical protein